MPYDWQDPPDPKDTYDRFTRGSERWFAPDDDNVERWDPGEPFTQAELDDYFRRGGTFTYRHPQQAKRDRRDARRAERIGARAGLTKLQQAWAREFDPHAPIAEAISVLTTYLERIKPSSRRNFQKWSRVKGVIKAILDGWTQAEIAADWSLDPGYLSRLMADVFQQHPNLKPAYNILNLLNNKEKRRDQSSRRASWLQWGKGKSDGDNALDVEQGPPYAHNHSGVKFAELHHRVFPGLSSNYCQVIAILREEVEDSFGTQRVLKRARIWDRRDDDADQTDYRATLWQDDTDRLHNTFDEWHRLRRCAGLPDKPLSEWPSWGLACIWPRFDVGELKPKRALSAARRFNREETIRKATIFGLPTRIEEPPKKEGDKPPSTPWSQSWRSPFVGAPSSNPGYLGPVGREITRHRFKAPLKVEYSRPDGYATAAPIERRIHNELATYLEQRDPGFDNIRSSWAEWVSQPKKVLEPPALAQESPHQIFHRRFRATTPIHTVLEIGDLPPHRRYSNGKIVPGGVVFIYRGYPVASNRCADPTTTLGGASINSDLPVSGLVKFDPFPISGPLGRGTRTNRHAAEVINHGNQQVNASLRKLLPEPGSTQISKAEWKTIEGRMYEYMGDYDQSGMRVPSRGTGKERKKRHSMCNPRRLIALPPVREPHGLLAPLARSNWITVPVKDFEVMTVRHYEVLVDDKKTSVPLYFIRKVT